MLLLVRILSYLPLRVLYGFSELLFVIAYYGIAYRKKVVLQNIKNSFPDKSPQEVKNIARKFYRNLSQVIIEIAKGYRISAKELADRVEIINPEVLGDYLKQNQSILLMAGHSANWEWILLRLTSYFGFPVDAIYKPLSNPGSEKLMLHIRSRFGGHPIPTKKTLRELIRRKGITRIFATVADQSPPFQEKRFWVNFLHQETAFYTGTEKLAQMTQYPVVFVGIHRLKMGHYQIYFEKLAEAPYPEKADFILENYAKSLEKLIHKQPEIWLWSHKRWKYPRDKTKASLNG